MSKPKFFTDEMGWQVYCFDHPIKRGNNNSSRTPVEVYHIAKRRGHTIRSASPPNSFFLSKKTHV